MKTNRFIWVSSGVLYIVVGAFQIYKYSNEGLSGLAWSYLIIGGLYLILYGYLGLSEKSKYAPKVVLTNEFIKIKKYFWKAGKKLKWSDISSIQYKSYQINFQIGKENYFFIYITNPDTSIEIKRAIREVAEINSIHVSGG